MRGVSEKGVDIRLVTAAIPWLAVLVLTGAAIGTDVYWQHWFFGVLAIILGAVTAWYSARVWDVLVPHPCRLTFEHSPHTWVTRKGRYYDCEGRS